MPYYTLESFAAGELSPSVASLEQTLDRYKSGLAQCRNFIPTVRGPVVRRPGTSFIAKSKSPNKPVVLVPFIFNTEQAYVIEFGDLYVRFYRNQSRIEVGGIPVEIISPYSNTDLSDETKGIRLQWAQSGDVLYLTHPDYPLQQLVRTSHTAWILSEVDVEGGPCFPENVIETNFLSFSAKTGSITVTATGHAPFVSTDVGRIIRCISSAGFFARAWGTITSFTSSTSVLMQSGPGQSFQDIGEEFLWSLGLWSDTTGFPRAITFFQDRLWLGGADASPQTLAASAPGRFDDYSIPATNFADDDSLVLTLSSGEINQIVWLNADERGLILGSSGGVWVISSDSSSRAVTANNALSSRISTIGSAEARPAAVDKATLFIGRSGHRLLEAKFAFESDGFTIPDMTVLSEHLFEKDIIAQMAFQRYPFAVLWVVARQSGTGKLYGFCYDRDKNQLAWSTHDLGKFNDFKCESVAVIPEGGQDEVWLSLRRNDGVSQSIIVLMNNEWVRGDEEKDANYMDLSTRVLAAPATNIVSDMDYLDDGDVVQVLADGIQQADATVASGAVTIASAANDILVGFSYSSVIQTLPISTPLGDGSGQDRMKTISNIRIRFQQTLNAKYGSGSSPQLDDYVSSSTTVEDFLTDVRWDHGNQFDPSIVVAQSSPFPMTIRAITCAVKVSDQM